jgi:sortase A
MQRIRLTKLPVFADFLIFVGILCVLTPIIWSLRLNIYQADERKTWVDEQKRAKSTVEPERWRLIIPELKLDAIVVEETKETDLDKGPMHLAGSPHPGYPGTCSIAAHKEKWFRGLARLSRGDKITLQVDKKSYIYAVTKQEIVAPDDIAALADTPGPTLTLITCTGRPFFGSSSGRLLVRCKLYAVK